MFVFEKKADGSPPNNMVKFWFLFTEHQLILFSIFTKFPENICNDLKVTEETRLPYYSVNNVGGVKVYGYTSSFFRHVFKGRQFL